MSLRENVSKYIFSAINKAAIPGNLICFAATIVFIAILLVLIFMIILKWCLFVKEQLSYIFRALAHDRRIMYNRTVKISKILRRTLLP